MRRFDLKLQAPYPQGMVVRTRDLLSNFGARAIAILPNIICAPIYTHLLGIECYGIIALFTTLYLLTAVFESGFGHAASRELTRLGKESRTAANVVKTFEVAYWLMSLFILAIFLSTSGKVAGLIQTSSAINQQDLSKYIALIGFSIFVYFPSLVYLHASLGLHSLFVYNMIAISMTIVRSLGSIGVLIIFPPKLEAFFLWQIGCLLVQTLLSKRHVKNILSGSEKGQFDIRIMLNLRKLIGKMSLAFISIVAVMQIDKLLAVYLLSLTKYGMYMIINTIAIVPAAIAHTMFSLYYPLATHYVNKKKRRLLIDSYQTMSECVVLLCLPLMATLITFATPILSIWTKQTSIAPLWGLTFQLLALGWSALALSWMPFAMQLAYGWTYPQLTGNILSIILIVPISILLSLQYGPMGLALGWLSMNSFNLLLNLWLMHRKILRQEWRRWILRIILIPYGANLTIGLLTSLLLEIHSFADLMIYGSINWALNTTLLFALLRPKLSILFWKTTSSGDLLKNKTSTSL